jgi:hypothetical protein
VRCQQDNLAAPRMRSGRKRMRTGEVVVLDDLASAVVSESDERLEWLRDLRDQDQIEGTETRRASDHDFGLDFGRRRALWRPETTGSEPEGIDLPDL